MRRLFHNRIGLAAAIALIFLGSLAQTRAGHTYCPSQFFKYFEGLGAADARVNPVERFVFSLLLTKIKPEAIPAPLPEAPVKQL
jgi:hypothetical protein